MTHKISGVRVEEYAYYYVNKLRQNVGLETRIWRQIVTSQRPYTTNKWPPYATEWTPPHEHFPHTSLLRRRRLWISRDTTWRRDGEPEVPDGDSSAPNCDSLVIMLRRSTRQRLPLTVARIGRLNRKHLTFCSHFVCWGDCDGFVPLQRRSADSWLKAPGA